MAVRARRKWESRSPDRSLRVVQAAARMLVAPVLIARSSVAGLSGVPVPLRFSGRPAALMFGPPPNRTVHLLLTRAERRWQIRRAPDRILARALVPFCFSAPLSSFNHFISTFQGGVKCKLCLALTQTCLRDTFRSSSAWATHRPRYFQTVCFPFHQQSLVCFDCRFLFLLMG